MRALSLSLSTVLFGSPVTSSRDIQAALSAYLLVWPCRPAVLTRPSASKARASHPHPRPQNRRLQLP
jgi:hypothetical protein